MFNFHAFDSCNTISICHKADWHMIAVYTSCHDTLRLGCQTLSYSSLTWGKESTGRHLWDFFFKFLILVLTRLEKIVQSVIKILVLYTSATFKVWKIT